MLAYLLTLIIYQILIMKQECKDCNKSLDDCTCIEDTIDMKQETTLEEAAKNYAEEYKGEEQDPWYDFMEGAKWQQERMYSEEEVVKIVEKSRETGLTVEFLLLTEQFKKK